MIFFLARNYFVNSAAFIGGIAIFPIRVGMDIGSAVSLAFFWGGIFGGLYTFYDFNNQNIWPLYDNLRHPKYLLIFEFFLLLQMINIILSQII